MSEDDEQQKIRATQIAMVYRSTVRTIPALAVVLGGLAYLIGDRVRDVTPYAWALLVFAIYMYRMWIAHKALQANLAPAELIAHSSIMTLITSLMGILAGGGLIYFFPRLAAESQALVTMICVGWIAGAVGVSGLYPRYIIPWFIAFGGSLVFSWAFFGENNRYLVASMLFVLVVYLWIAVKDIGHKTAESIRISFTNVDLNNALTATLEAKSRFMAAASHDLRQPLMSINLIYANLIGASDTNDAIQQARKLIRPVRALESILDSLVMIARLETKPPEPVKIEFDLQNLGDELAEEFQARADLAAITFHVQADPVMAVADRHLATRCLRNLMDNAFKFTTAGSINVALRCPDPHTLAVSIMDTGEGIADDEVSHIFDAYYQVPAAGRTSQGVGLGLAIVDRLVRLQGGSVSVCSVRGAGSTFSLRLPADNYSKRDPPLVDTSDATRTGDDFSSRKLELLFIEDDPSLQDEWSEWCSRNGHTSFFAANGAEALSMATGLDGQPDAIVADYRLPDGNGLQVIAELKKTWPSIPAVLLTGDTDPSISFAAAEAQVRVMRKPTPPDMLISEILEMMQR